MDQFEFGDFIDVSYPNAMAREILGELIAQSLHDVQVVSARCRVKSVNRTKREIIVEWIEEDEPSPTPPAA